MEFGLGSSLFAVSLAFSSIVMYDAAGVRRHAGKGLAVIMGCLCCSAVHARAAS